MQVLYTIGEVNIAELTSASILVSEGFINSNLFQTLGINNSEVFVDKIIIHPNPASNNINIASKIEFSKIKMYDVMGKKVFESNYLNKIKVENYKSGVYILKIYFPDTIVTKRIIKK